MAKLDRRAEIANQLAPQLAQGESVRAVIKVDLADGVDARPDEGLRQSLREAAEQAQQRSALSRGGDSVVGAVGGLAAGFAPFNIPFPDVSKWLSGTRIAGPDTSLASQLMDLLQTGGDHYLAATGPRLFLMLDGSDSATRMKSIREGTSAAPYQQQAEITPSQLMTMRQAGKGVMRGRVELYFTDASMLALQTVPAFTSKAVNELLDAAGVKG